MSTVPFSPGTMIPGMGGGNSSGSMTSLPGMPNSGPAPFSTGNMFNLFPANGLIPFNMSSLIPGMGGSNGSGGGFNIFNTSGKPDQMFKETLGGGGASLMEQALQTGGFNPAIASAFINQSMPLYGRGMEGIANEFSGLGERFSSAAAVGMGDFSSQFFNNLMGQLAGLDNEAINRSFGLLKEFLPMQQQQKANEGSWFDTVRQIAGIGSQVLPHVPGVGAWLGL